jgi:cytochrome b6-f complex iron-sulfur subunit
MSESTNHPVSRRSFLDVLLAAGIVGTGISAGFPVLRYLKPLPLSGASGPVRLDDAQVGKLEADRFVIVSAGPKRIMVFEDEAHKLRALAAKCTHEGCTVQYSTAESVVWCACHNARFDIDGRVLSGPPPKPLQEYEVVRGDDGSIILNLESA